MKTTGMKKSLINRLEEEARDTDILQGLTDLHINDVPHKDLMDIARRRLKREILRWAQNVVDVHMTTHWLHRNGDGFPKEYGKHHARVVMREWTLYVEWYEQTYSIENGKTKPRAKSIPLPPSTGKATRVKMPLSKFLGAKDWEKESIIKAEEELTKIRRCANYLKEIQLAMSGIYQLLERRGIPDDGDIDYELLAANQTDDYEHEESGFEEEHDAEVMG